MPGCSLQPMHTPHTPPWHAHVCVPTHLGTLHAHTCTHTLVCTPCKHTCAHGCILQARCTVSATRGSPGALRLLRAPSGPPALSQGLGSMGGRPRRGSEPWETLAAGLGEATECCRNGAKQTSSSRRTAKLARTQRGTPSPKPRPHTMSPSPRLGGLRTSPPTTWHTAQLLWACTLCWRLLQTPDLGAPQQWGHSSSHRGEPQHPRATPRGNPPPWGGRAGCRGGWQALRSSCRAACFL